MNTKFIEIEDIAIKENKAYRRYEDRISAQLEKLKRDGKQIVSIQKLNRNIDTFLVEYVDCSDEINTTVENRINSIKNFINEQFDSYFYAARANGCSTNVIYTTDLNEILNRIQKYLDAMLPTNDV